MPSLVIEYALASSGQILLTSRLRDNDNKDWLIEQTPCSGTLAQISELSEHVLQRMRGAFESRGEPGHDGGDEAREALSKALEKGEEMTRLLLPQGSRTLEFLTTHAGLFKELVFRCDPTLMDIHFEGLHVSGDFLCMKYGIGRDAAPWRGSDLPSSSHPLQKPLTSCFIVDPSRESPVGQTARDTAKRFVTAWTAQDKLCFLASSCRIGHRSISDLKQALASVDIFNILAHGKGCNTDQQRYLLDGGAVFQGGDVPTSSDSSLLSLVLAGVCQSARYGGLTKAFLKAGVRHYIGTVTEGTPSDFVASIFSPFYSALIQGDTVGMALTGALQQLAQNDPLWGRLTALAFRLYGDPSLGYFCGLGHVVSPGVPTLRCGFRDQNNVPCGRIVCPQDAGFSEIRCGSHWTTTCSAGHPVANPSTFKKCKHCDNTVCLLCGGYGRELCWQHWCSYGHPIKPGHEAHACRGGMNAHKPNERRSVCTRDGDGWIAQKCPDCV